jgi:hypothetical protein
VSLGKTSSEVIKNGRYVGRNLQWSPCSGISSMGETESTMEDAGADFGSPKREDTSLGVACKSIFKFCSS